MSRFGYMPFNYEFLVPERFLNFSTGDVVDVESINVQGANGLPSGNLRLQITNITPQYKNTGRQYKVKGMSYESRI